MTCFCCLSRRSCNYVSLLITVSFEFNFFFAPHSDNMSGRKPTEKIEKLQAHVAEVSNIMTENINKILDRGQRLDDLEGRSGESFV